MVIAEDFGWVGILCGGLFFAVFVAAGLYVSAHARDRFGYLLGAGIVSLIGIQVLAHLACIMHFLPTKPVPLPFVSYGGSELCVLLIGVGMLLNIARDLDRSKPDLPAP